VDHGALEGPSPFDLLAQVFINFFQNRTAAEKTAEDVSSLGARVYLHQADLKDEEQIRRMFNEVQRQFGGLDVLVHSAAAGVLRSVTELSAKHWDWVMNTNARSLLLCAREGGAMMHEGGRIISLSSLGSGRVIPQYSSIGVSKAALESLTRYLAVEFAPRGISVNTVSAGAVATEVWDLVLSTVRHPVGSLRRKTLPKLYSFCQVPMHK